MQIIPEILLKKLAENKDLNRAALEIDSAIENIISDQSPVFFPEYTDHGIRHFSDTLKMGLHLIDLDQTEKISGQIPVIDRISPLNAFILIASTLFHDIGMHIHFKGFKQLIAGEYDNVRVDYFDDLTWQKEWENFMIEAKRFSGRQRINLFGDEQVIIQDVDFSKNSVDSDIQKKLIGEFIRRHHGRLAHEISIKGFPAENYEVIPLVSNINEDFKDIVGLIARSHSLDVRDALEYVPTKFPADPRFPYEIEIPFLMCLLRIADYFQFDSSRTNSFIIKLKSFESPFSLNEHKTHLASQYFKTDANDPETLFVHLTPPNGVLYNKLLNLFIDIQRELDTSFAILGEMYGRYKDFLKLRYRRIRTNLKNNQVIKKLNFVVGVHGFEADTDLFKLLVGPLYGYDPSFGVRELIQNSVDACLELKHKLIDYTPLVKVNLTKSDDDYLFSISDNGKGMSIGEIKNYFLKAGSSFRNSIEWKIDYEDEKQTPAIRRTGKFGIGVLASFLIGDSIDVTTRRYNENIGYKFSADLTSEYIEIIKEENCDIGTTINISISRDSYEKLMSDDDSKQNNLTKWYLLNYPPVVYKVNDRLINGIENEINLKDNEQFFNDSIQIDYHNFDSIAWGFSIKKKLAINGIMIPGKYHYPSQYNYYESRKPKTIYDELDEFPFLSILDRNNLVDLELNRNSIRGHLPFIKELVQSCKLDFLFKLLFYKPPIEGNQMDFSGLKPNRYESDIFLQLNAPQFNSKSVLCTTNGYFLDNIFYNAVNRKLSHYKISLNQYQKRKIEILDNSTYNITLIGQGPMAERSVLRGNYGAYLGITRPEVYINNHLSSSIAKHIRDELKVVKEDKKYIIFKRGDWKRNSQNDLMLLYKNNHVEAIQIMNKTLNSNEVIYTLLKDHLVEPKLIPIEYAEKIKYVKTLSKELQKHIEEKRGIDLT